MTQLRSPEAGGTNRDSRRLALMLIYWLPLVIGVIVLFVYGAGERGRYETSLLLTQRAILFLTPDLPHQPADRGIITTWTMYEINGAFRSLAHVGLYAVLTFLLVRVIQQGHHRLKPASIIAAVIGSVVFVAADEMKRAHELSRHAKPEDIILNAIGVGITLGGTLLFFALKALERRLATPETADASVAAVAVVDTDAAAPVTTLEA